MIVLNLHCNRQHRFEGWFASAEKFAGQRAAHQVECPICGSLEVERLPSAPSIARSGKPALQAPTDQARVREALQHLRKWENGAENVGTRFPEEARRMHYGEAEQRDIRGTASVDVVRELAEEGIPVLPVPPVVAEEIH